MTSEEFRKIRERLGWTQSQLAEKMAMDVPSISRIENGWREPTKIQAAFIRHLFKNYGGPDVDPS